MPTASSIAKRKPAREPAIGHLWAAHAAYGRRPSPRNQLAEGNGESLTIYSDSVIINELGHVVGVKSQNTNRSARVPFNLREEARDGLADW